MIGQMKFNKMSSKTNKCPNIPPLPIESIPCEDVTSCRAKITYHYDKKGKFRFSQIEILKRKGTDTILCFNTKNT